MGMRQHEGTGHCWGDKGSWGEGPPVPQVMGKRHVTWMRSLTRMSLQSPTPFPAFVTL